MKVGVLFFVVYFTVGVFSAKAWDIAVAIGAEIQFLRWSGEAVGNVTDGLRDVQAMVYNSDLQRMYFTENNHPDGSIFQITVPKTFTAEVNQKVDVIPVLPKQNYPVKGVAYDDMTGILYWSNGVRQTISWQMMNTNPNKSQVATLLNLHGQNPIGLAIDNCKRYLYWTNCNDKPTIERSFLDGSHREIIVDTGLEVPYAVVVDQTTEKLYWVDARSGSEFRIESLNLDSRRELIYKGLDHKPFSMAVNNNNFFWVDHISKSVWRLPLDSTTNETFKIATYRSTPLAVVSAQSGHWISGKCNPIQQPIFERIPATITYTTAMVPIMENVTPNHPIDNGESCKVDKCLNYCVHGKCSSGPSCQCEDGYTGLRCETSPTPVCHNYCLYGHCTVDNATGHPQCHCKEGFSGDRCEVNYTQEHELRNNLQEVCNTFCKLWAKSEKEDIQPFNVCSCPEFGDGSLPQSAPPSSSWWQDHLLIALLALCTLLMVLVAVLTKKVVVLRKRPRIKKRIIVNKTTTPLTCRPSPNTDEQCEITIENCCNMNICETPCFEPDFRQPQSTLKNHNKGGKEEKKTLLGNMDLPPDDLY